MSPREESETSTLPSEARRAAAPAAVDRVGRPRGGDDPALPGRVEASGTSRARAAVLNVALLLVSVGTLAGLIESVSHLLLARRGSPPALREAIGLYAIEPHPDYGWVLLPNSSHRAVKAFESGEICYDVVYRTDAFGRRVTSGPDVPRGRHLLLFGGSTTMGEGLPDEETLQHFLERSLTDHDVYDYAVHGYGPSHMLAQLESGTLPGQVASRRGRALYLMIPEHVSRVTGDTRAFWVYPGPRYVMSGSGVTREGSFVSTRANTTALYQAFLALKKRSSFLTLINLDLPPWISEQALELTARILLRSKELYESQFDGSFTVVLHPSWNLAHPQSAKAHDWLRQRLQRADVEVLDYSRPGGLRAGERIHPDCDAHPNGRLNRRLAAAIVEDLALAR